MIDATEMNTPKANLAAATATSAARRRQDKRYPFLINVQDARLYPNVQSLREDRRFGKNYRVFTGSAKATLEERRRWLETQGAAVPRQIVDSTEAPPFDIGKASPREMIEFALSEYQEVLDPGLHHNQMRARLRELAKQHGALLAS